MHTFFITANDTDVGKTYVTGILARHFAAHGYAVQIVKAIECGGSGDAEWARTFAGAENITAHTLLDYPEPLAPLAKGNVTDSGPTLAELLKRLEQLPQADVRLIEGAGGIAVPIDSTGLDWRDFIDVYQPDLTIAVIDNRLGSINQSRLIHHYLGERPHTLLLNETSPIDSAVNASNHDALRDLPLLGSVETGATVFELLQPDLFNINPIVTRALKPHEPRIEQLEARRSKHIFRQTNPRPRVTPYLDLSDNDTLGLRQHPALIESARTAITDWGTSSSASPLITGYTQAHADLEATLSDWYEQRPALLWNSGYAANQAILKLFVDPDDLILADRLIHNSLISGALQSGARIIRFRHNDVAHLASLLSKHSGTRRIHVVTESVYSMDGDTPDLKQIAYLKSQYDFNWILDEAHAVGWYGESGAGLAVATNVLQQVDILVGTLGKALASSGAYTIFKQAWMRDYCVNEAGEFIYSTYLPPSSAAAAQAAIGLVQANPQWRPAAQQLAFSFRESLRAYGWEVLGHDSAVVPVVCGESEKALKLADQCLKAGIRVGAIRPPTVPKGQARLRISLKSTLKEHELEQLYNCFELTPTPHA